MFKRFLVRLLPRKQLFKRYLDAGSDFGFAVSYLYMGESVDFEERLDRWAFWEQEYLRRGFQVVSLDKFVKAGGYDEDISQYLGIRNGDKFVAHATIYREKYLGKVAPVIDPLANKVQFAEYVLPSTENAE